VVSLLSSDQDVPEMREFTPIPILRTAHAGLSFDLLSLIVTILTLVPPGALDKLETKPTIVPPNQIILEQPGSCR
jgi:hypothetical protein